MIVSVSARLALLLLEGYFVYYCVVAENPEQYQALRRRLTLQTLSITDVGENQITVNAGVTTLLVTLTGASGGRALNSAHGQYGLGGLGGVITAYIPVIPGENLKFFIGGAGTSNGAGGFNGGGSPCTNANLPGGSGGGATDLRRSPYGLANRLLVAGGGGGAYSEYIANGGAGGYPNGADGDQGDGVYRTPSAYPPGGGGTQTQGGTGTNGQAGALGQGGNCQGANGAGGGGGYYGGGSAFAVGCGGGSSYASAGYVGSGVAAATGDGSAVVSWDIEPTIAPSTNPSVTPTAAPSSQPSSQPSRQPSLQPVAMPSGQPSLQPSHQPTSSPTVQPSAQPSGGPTDQPTGQPSMSPTQQPVGLPSSTPSNQPTTSPTGQPTTQPSGQPSKQPSGQPSSHPTNFPTMQPTNQPSCQPSGQPSARPTSQPLSQPSVQPSSQPSVSPSVQPSTQPSSKPSSMPSTQPSVQPSKLPTTQPISQPSSQPSDTPSVQPSQCPTTQPSVQPSKQPSAQPSSNPTSPPTSQPSMNPSAQPSAQPIAAPTAQPSMQPSSLPSVQPSERPSSQPSEQPSCQPSGKPSMQPSSSPSGEPSAQPSLTPSVQPSVAPSMQPSTQPTHDPTSQPLAVPSSQPASTPTAQPSQQPSSQPLCEPSVQPSSAPTAWPTLQFHAREYAYLMPSEARMTLTNVAHIGGADWGCGAQLGSATCVVVVSPGILRALYSFPWNETTSALQTSDLSRVVLTGHIMAADSAITAIAKCTTDGTQLLCTVKSFRGTVYRASALVLSAGKIVYVGTSSGFTTLAILDEALSVLKSYKYTSSILGSITLSQIQSTPNFIGSFIAGTCTSVGLKNYIFLGMVRTDSGVMTGMYLSPASNAIQNGADLVNTMALEYVHPDSYIAGGLQLLGESEVTAYIVRVNGLFQSVLYGVRYRAIWSESRRLHSAPNLVNSVVKGLVIVDSVLYVLISWNASLHEDGINRISLLRTDLVTGALLQQVHIVSHNISLHCTDMTSAGLLLTLSCAVHYPVNDTQSILLSFDRELTFSKLPDGFMKDEEKVFLAESMLFKRVSVPLTVHIADITSTEYTFTTAEIYPTVYPTREATGQPTSQPSGAPSGQPSSSPTAAPSVSPQPTRHPSSSGPTNTYEPTVKPTPRPSAIPSPNPTVTPTRAPSKQPTARPTVHSSRHPTAQPSAARTTTTSRAPKSNPSTKPTAAPSVAVTVVQSAETESADGGIHSDGPTASSRRNNSNIVLVTGGSIVGGLLLLWCGHRLLRWYFLALDARERKNAMRIIIERKQSLLIQDLLSTDIKAQSRIDRGYGRGANATGPPVADSAFSIDPNVAAPTPPDQVPELINLPCEMGSCDVSSISASGLGSESSLELSSLHSSEMSLFDNCEILKTGALTELSTPIALSLHTQSRSQESDMEEGNVATEVSNNEHSSMTSEDSIQVSSESDDN